MSARDLLDLVWIVPALPLAGAVINLFFGKRIGEPNAGRLAALLMFLAFLASIVVFAAMISLPGDARRSGLSPEAEYELERDDDDTTPSGPDTSTEEVTAP